MTKAAPVAAVAATTLAAWGLDLAAQGVAVVGVIPSGLPPFTLPSLDPALWQQMAAPAFFIGLSASSKLKINRR